MNDVFPFDPNFHEFSLYHWNDPPVTTWMDEDEIVDRAKSRNGDIHVRLNGVPTVSHEVYADIIGLTAVYHHFVLEDENIRSVVFHNAVAGVEDAAVQAIVWIEGHDPFVEDWSEDAEKTFCRDIPAQDVQELGIVISNSNWENIVQSLAPGDQPWIEFKQEGCTAWKGHVDVTVTEVNPAGEVTTHLTASNVRFEHSETLPVFGEGFRAVDGTVHWAAGR